MTTSSNMWQARSALCELLALSFHYPDDEVLSNAILSGEWIEAANELSNVLDMDIVDSSALEHEIADRKLNTSTLQSTLRPEATRLFFAPYAAVSPYESVWEASEEGTQALLFASPTSIAVEHFCKTCGLVRPEKTNEPLDSVWTELELLEYLAFCASSEVASTLPDEIDTDSRKSFPKGSPAAAYEQFMREHAAVWMPKFAKAVQEKSQVGFYKAAAELLAKFIDHESTAPLVP